jgi:hypothetical protein
MTERTRQVRGVTVPTLCYGTPWEEERTGALVAQALTLGFRGIDTANSVGITTKPRWDVPCWLSGSEEHCVVKTSSCRPSSLSGRARITGCPMTRPRSSGARSNNPSIARDHISVWMLWILIYCHAPSLQQGLSPADIEAWRVMKNAS